MNRNEQFTSISPSILPPRLPELGKIKIGGKGPLVRSKKGNEFRRPVKFDHFRVTTRSKDDEDQWILDERVHTVVGKEPTELDVRLLFNEPEQNFQYYLAAYSGRSLKCRGNGEVAYDEELEKEIACTCPLLAQHEGSYDGPKRPVGKVSCKPHGRLSVAIEAAASFGGFYVFRTTSWETIGNLASQLKMFRNQFGFLAGLPLKLVLYPAQDTYQQGGRTRTSESYKVALVLRATYKEALHLAASAHEERKKLALPSGADVAEIHSQALLEAEERDVEEIATEFHPETQEGFEEVEFEVVDEQEDGGDDHEDEQHLEQVLGTALELADWDQLKTNRQLAKYSGRLDELEGIIEKQMPSELEQARRMVAQAEGAEEEPDDNVPVEEEDDDDLF